MDVDDPSRPVFLSSAERRDICESWERASSQADVGCELVARLLNDNRTRFRATLECKSGSLLGSGNYTPQDVSNMKRASAVARGVNSFFNKAVSRLDSENFVEELQSLSLQLGAMHFRMRVWFQAENWLCVKNCLLDSVVAALNMPSKGKKTICGGGRKWAAVDKSLTEAWYKFIQFVIQNMKRGFLQEALNLDGMRTAKGTPGKASEPPSMTSTSSPTDSAHSI